MRKDNQLPAPNNIIEKNADSNMVISFLRHEVLFNHKKSIVINVRDLTAQESLFESKAKIKQLSKVVTRLSSELERPISRFRKNSDQLARTIGMQPII